MSNLEAAFIGASASIVANTIVYPLDLIKTVIQTQVELKKHELQEEILHNKSLNGSEHCPNDEKLKHLTEVHYKNSLDCLLKIYKKQGISGLYKGLGSSLLSTAIQSFTYFYWYSFVRRLYRGIKVIKQFKPAFTTPEELALGAVAAAISQLFTNPISVISTRQQVNPTKNTSILVTAKNIIDEDGITGLWRGLKVSMVLTINPSITYGTFERLKAVLFKGQRYLHPQESFVLGVLSKMLATITTQPLIISKVMLQKNDDDKNEHLKSFQSVLRYLIKHEGITSLWKGVLPQLSKGVLVQGFIFMFKDQLNLLFKTLFLLVKLKMKRQRKRPLRA